MNKESLVIKKHGEISENEALKLGDIFLCAWGKWSISGNELTRIGSLHSTLGGKTNHQTIDDDVGEVVDGIIALLPSEIKMLAILSYQKHLTIASVSHQVGMSGATIDIKLRALRLSIYLAIKMFDKT